MRTVATNSVMLAIAITCLTVVAALIDSARASGEEPAQNTVPSLNVAAFAENCRVCHGEGATGTERAPSLVNNPDLRGRSEAEIHDIIRHGTQGGMPAFALPEALLTELARWVRSKNSSAYSIQPAGNAAAGEQLFFGAGGCSACHMIRGSGGSRGPDLSDVGQQLTLGEIEQAIDDPSAPRVKTQGVAGCPPWAYCPQSTWDVVRVELRDGAVLRGFARNQGAHDLQLQDFAGHFHLLTDSDYSRVTREPTVMPALKATAEERRDLIAWLSRLNGVSVGLLSAPETATPAEDIDRLARPRRGDWPTYNGLLGGNRYSALSQINMRNVDQMQVQWTYQMPFSPLQTTPLVIDGIMYVTGPNQVCALDGRSGREIWCYSRPRSAAETIAGSAAKGANRGVAVLGNRVFFGTDNAHLLSLNRITGALMWDIALSEVPGLYGVTSAPLVAGNLIITGVSGGDGPIKGFIAAYEATTGRQVWRFNTVPPAGDPAADTWQGSAIEHGGSATWLTGSYDTASGLLYWPTANPFPDSDGSQRGGDNLYSNCVVVLDAKSGALRWYFQFTPHDLHDWDATEPLVLVDARYRDRERKLLLQANRNGFFYVLDRVSGEVLQAKPFVKRITWASGIGANGRPILTVNNETTAGGTSTCPAVRGATNWYSTAYNPDTRLFYVMATEDCNVYKTSDFGLPVADPNNLAEKYLRAIDPESGVVAWEIAQVGVPETNYSGVLTTAGGLVFYGETSGGFAAVDARRGKTLWHFESGQAWKASPMSYAINGRQYVAIAGGNSILSFAIPGQRQSSAAFKARQIRQDGVRN